MQDEHLADDGEKFRFYGRELRLPAFLFCVFTFA